VNVGQKYVSLDFVQADINDVLKALAVQTGANIVTGNDAKGTVTVSLTHTTLDNALAMVTRLSGLEYALINGTYVVGSAENIAQLTGSTPPPANTTTQLVTFNNAGTDDIIGVLAHQYPNLKATPGTSNGLTHVIYLTGDSAEIENAKALIAEIDNRLISVPLGQQVIVAYRVKYAAVADLVRIVKETTPSLYVTLGPSQGFSPSISSTSSTSGGGGSSTSSSSPSPSGGSSPSSSSGSTAGVPGPDMILLRGSQADIDGASAILAKTDVRPAMINYETKVSEVDLTNEKKLGLNWDFSGATTRFGENPDNIAVPPATLSKSGTPLGLGAIERTPISDLADVSLDLSNAIDNSKLLADPNISAIDGYQASVFIGDTITYENGATVSTTGTSFSTATINVGVNLSIVGKSDGDGYITVTINPQVNTVTGFTIGTEGVQLPQLASRSATTTLRVKDGQTIAIGGLIQDQDIVNVNKVPILGDLPLFGQLFRDTEHNKDKTEVIFFIKTSLAKDTDL
jgi:type II secretory pathway component GspD/PulD (secretin)